MSSSPLIANTRCTDAPSPFASGTIKALAGAKIALGAACIIAPRLTCRLFLLDLPIEGAVIGRLFGTGVLSFGALTWSMDQWAHGGRVTKAGLQRALWLNLLEDAIDVGSCAVGFTSGVYGPSTFGLLGGGCAALGALGVVGLKALSIS